MKAITRILVILAFSLMISACSTVRITTDYDKTVDFNALKTFGFYGWSEESDKIINDLEKKRIEAAFLDEFEKRGISYVESGGDMIVSLHVMTQEKTQYNATTTGLGYGGFYGYGPGWGWGPGMGMGMASTTVNEYKYTVGTLVIDIYHTGDEKLVWEGIATGTVDDNPQNREKNIPKVVAKIMALYPVTPPEAK